MGSQLPDRGLNLRPLHSKADSYHWTTREDPCYFPMSALKEARKDELYIPFSSSCLSQHDLTLLPPPRNTTNSASEALVRIIWKPAGKVPSIRLLSLARLYPLPRITVLLLFAFDSKEQGPQESGTQTLPGHPTFLGLIITRQEEGKAGGDTVCFLFCFLVSFWLVVKGTQGVRPTPRLCGQDFC